MQIFNDISRQSEPCCTALGFFDGVHIGHQQLLCAMTEHAAKFGLAPAVFTFADAPSAAPGKNGTRTLMTPADKYAKLRSLGAQRCFSVDFQKYKDVSAESFVNDILIDTLNSKAVVCGQSYRFGKGAAGDTSLLAEICRSRGVTLIVAPPVCSGGEVVSSSRIRSLIEQGKMQSANELLGSPFALSGTVVHGKQNGRTVGIPTLNQMIPDGFVIPRFGAYASFAVIGGRRFPAVTNIGVRPTVSGSGVNCETHVLENIGEIYGDDLRTELLWFERDERRFDSLSELSQQIKLDISHIKSLRIYESAIGGCTYD